MSRGRAGRLALLVSLPGWVAILALLALKQVSVPAAVSAGLAVLALAIAVVRYLAKDMARLCDWLRGRGENRAGLAAPLTGVFGDIAGDVGRIERHWQQQHDAQARHIADQLAMLDGLPDPVLTLDERAVVVFANDAARMLLDGDNRVVTGRALSSLLRQPGLLAAIGAVIDGEPARQIEITLAGQVERFVEAWVEPLSGAHGARVLVVMRDMTVVRRGEGVRAGFVANVSHELRTPLAS
ncbi:MAG: PAS domain-containing protein, partial [Alphaproteobacteria bacterium]